MSIQRDVLNIDIQAEIRSITSSIRSSVHEVLRKKGVVVAVSGGIDSSACAALCTAALEREHILLLFLPDRDSSVESRDLVDLLARNLGVHLMTEPIGSILEKVGCYARQDEAVRMVFPEYQSGWPYKLTLPSILSGDRLNVSRLTIQTGAGERLSQRMSPPAYLQLVAATNFKQRIRTMMAYYHADRLNYAVCGTPNRLEYDQGFFVKGGDGLADFKPIAHLYKTQVYAIARALDVPDKILNRTPTTETFSLPQTQEEFYFGLPYEQMDLCLYGFNHGVPPTEVALVVNLTPEQVERVYHDIETKRRTTLPLHLHSLMAESVAEIELLKDSSVRSRRER